MLSIALAISVVATAVSGVWRIVNDGASDSIRIAMWSVGILILGAALQELAPIGLLAGILAAIAFAANEVHEAVNQRRWHIELRVAEPVSASTRLILHDRIDLLERRPRRIMIVRLSLVALSLIGVSSIWRGLDSAFRPWLFLGCLILLLPAIHAIAAALRAGELRYLHARLAKLDVGGLKGPAR